MTDFASNIEQTLLVALGLLAVHFGPRGGDHVCPYGGVSAKGRAIRDAEFSTAIVTPYAMDITGNTLEVWSGTL